MKKLIILLVLIVMLAGCDSIFKQDRPGSSPFTRSIGIARKANAASSPLNPYAGLIEIGLGLVTVIASGGYAIKSRQFVKADKKYTAHKRVLEAKMRELPQSASDGLYAEVGKERKKLGL